MIRKTLSLFGICWHEWDYYRYGYECLGYHAEYKECKHCKKVKMIR